MIYNDDGTPKYDRSEEHFHKETIKYKMIKHIFVNENLDGPDGIQVIYHEVTPLHLDEWI